MKDSNKMSKKNHLVERKEVEYSEPKRSLVTGGAYAGAVFFLEIALHIWVGIPFSLMGVIGQLLTAVGIGALLVLISGITPSKRWNKWLCFALLEILAIIYVVTYFTDNSFGVFMNIPTLFSGAEDVMTDFSDRIATLATKGLPAILFFHAPSILHIIFAGKILSYKQRKWQPAVLSFVAGLAVIVITNLLYFNVPSTKDICGLTYEYDGAVRNLGLITAMQLDARYAWFGNPYEDMVVINTKQGDIIDYGALEDVEEDGPALAMDMSYGAGVESLIGEEAIEAMQQQDASSENTDAQNGEADAEEAAPEEERPKEYGYNVMAINFDSLIAETKQSTLQNAYSFVQSLMPSHKNEYTGLFKDKNLILITAEAFSKEVIDEERTPTLYRMANQGIVFEDYYQPAWGGSTSTGEFSVLMGTIPVDGVSSIKETIGHNLYFTMGNQLQRLGYFSRAYHNNTYTYYGRDKTHENFGYEKFIGYGNGMEEGVTKCWPQSDLEMLQFTLPQYIDQQPFSVYYMTVSGHCLYNWGGNKMSSKNKEAVADMEDASSTIKAYHAANLELEYAMQYLIESLEEAGIANDTVICLTADHYPYGLSQSTTWGNDKDYLAELYGYKADTNPKRDHSALLIWSGCLEEMEPIVVSEPTYSLDIVPTLSNLFGVKFDSRLAIGRDALSDAQPLVIWNDYDWMTELGYYEAGKGKFTPFDETIELPEDYITNMKNIVKGKMTVSKAALKYDFYEEIISAWTKATNNENE